MPQNYTRLRPVSLALLVVLNTPWVARGALPDAQVLRGEVVDPNNAPIAGAVCTLAGPTLPEQGRPVTTGERGTFEFTGLIPGSYQLTCAAVGYEPVAQNEIPVTETQAPTLQVTLPAEVIVRQKVEVTAQAPKATLETTAPPAIISSQQLRSLPLVQQKFKAALPLIPGVVRTPDGRIAIKGAIENQGTLLVDSAETVDPVTGSFSIDVPIDAVESVDVFKSAYQAEYGRFSGGLTTVQTKAPSNRWDFELNDFIPTPRIRSGQVVGIQDDTPRIYFTGPLWKDKLTFSESFMYEFSRQPVRGLAWPNNETRKQGFESFTDFFFVFSPQHLTSFNVKLFPVRRQFDNINSLIPQTASADYGQSGYSLGAHDHYLFTGGGILTTLVQFTQFDSYSHGQGPQDMLVTPNGWLGNFFNAWTRSSAQQQIQQSYQFARREWHGRHAFKAGGISSIGLTPGPVTPNRCNCSAPTARWRSKSTSRPPASSARKTPNSPALSRTTGPSMIISPWTTDCDSPARHSAKARRFLRAWESSFRPANAAGPSFVAVPASSMTACPFSLGISRRIPRGR